LDGRDNSFDSFAINDFQNYLGYIFIRMLQTDRKKLIYFPIFAAFIIASLLILPFLNRPIKDYLVSFFKASEEQLLVGDLFDVFYRLIYVVLWMSLVIIVVRFLNILSANTLLRKAGNIELATLLQNVFSIVIYVFAFVIIVRSQFNVDLTTVFAGGTILGVVLGLALQDTLGNLFAGLALQADQPFQIGDVISLPGRSVTGIVENVSWRGIKIRTFQNRILLISNSVLGKEIIEVAPQNNANARLVQFSTIYQKSPAKVVRVVREAIRNIENVSSKFRPQVRIRSLGENGIEWEIKYWLENYAKYNETDAQIRMRLWYVFQREGIEFAYPTRVVYSEEKKSSSGISTEEIANLLRKISIFSPLTADEIRKLAKNCEFRVYSPDEPITVEGQIGDSMFVIYQGKARVQVMDNKVPKTIATLGEGDFFGEMGLFTGQPRTASVISEEETKILRIKKSAVKPLLDDNPDLVQAFSDIIAERQLALQNINKDSLEERHVSDESKSFVRLIKDFFGLNKS
jgi:small-conductance mechanosensitive channel/CRP-like cAMP-binding protein